MSRADGLGVKATGGTTLLGTGGRAAAGLRGGPALRLMDLAGIEADPTLFVYRDRGEYEAQITAVRRRGLKLVFQHVHPPHERPRDDYWMLVWLPTLRERIGPDICCHNVRDEIPLKAACFASNPGRGRAAGFAGWRRRGRRRPVRPPRSCPHTAGLQVLMEPLP